MISGGKKRIYKVESSDINSNGGINNKMKSSTKRSIKRITAIALLFLAGYYLLVAAGVILSTVVFGSYHPDNTRLALIAISLVIIALLLDDDWRAKVKNAFS